LDVGIVVKGQIKTGENAKKSGRKKYGPGDQNRSSSRRKESSGEVNWGWLWARYRTAWKSVSLE